MIITKKRILHISPHLGGGVGRVLLSYLSHTKTNELFEHSIYCLDSINNNAKEILLKNSINSKELVSQTPDILLEEIAFFDIIVIHWWNHPLLFDFLIRYEIPPCRIAFWAHVSGNEAPNIFSHTLFDYPDYFIFTTPISYLVQEVTSYPKADKFKTIWATGGLDHVKNIIKKEHNNFNIGYIGTVDYSKMHSSFIDICESIDINNVKFIVCGGGDIEELQKEISKRVLTDKFLFTGFVNDISPYLEIFDLFAYPLAENHYGTCDQALAEAMGCGIVPIVFNNNMENYMVDNMYSGIIVKNKEEFITAVKELYLNKNFRDRLGEKAKEEAFRRFSIDETIKEWDCVFHELLKKEKSAKKWNGKYKGKNVEPYQVFLESIGKYSSVFELNDTDKIKQLFNSSHSWKSKTKGSIHHYYYFFNDKKLKELSQNND